MLERAAAVYDDPVASEFVWGMAYHWYGDARFETWPPRVEVPFQDRQQEGAVVKELKACAGFENVRRVADLQPEKHLLFTEGCQELGERPLATVLGDWKIAERYAMNIIADMNSGCEGWIDWNLVLNQEGGPNHVGNNCVAPVICDTSKDAVLYQPAFWYLGHFSRYIRPGAQRLLCSTTRDALEVTAYKNTDGGIAVVVLNQSEEPISFWLKVKEEGEQRATALLAPALQDAEAAERDIASRQTQESLIRSLTNSSNSFQSDDSQQVKDLQAKNQALEAALRSRDAQATQMIADCTDIDNQNQKRMTEFESELADAVKARKQAEDERDAVEVKAAGDKAKSASSLAAANEDRLKLEDRDRKAEARASEAQVELDAARFDLRQTKQREAAQIQHQEKAKELSDNRAEELEGLLNSANRQLALLRRDTSSLGNTATDRETSLQEQVDELIEERTQNRKDMSEARLELLGLKKKQAMQAIDQAKSPSELRQAHQAAGGGGGGRSRGRGRGKGASKGMLEIIEEEQEEEDGSVGLPARAAESLASECSSDCGDLDDLTNPDQSAQNDLLNKLLSELTVERKAKQDLRDDHAGQQAEQMEEIAQLQRQLAEAGLVQAAASAENFRLRDLGNQDRIKQLNQVDGLNVKVRELEETLFVEMKKQTDKEERQEMTNVELQEKVQLQAESLRISNLRLQDALQQRQTEAIRQLQEVNSLKLQLAMECKRNGRSSDDAWTADAKDGDPEVALCQRVKELEEERNLLLSKLEVQEVQHQVQLEDAYRDHASRLQEQRLKFEEQIAEIRSRYEQLLRQMPAQGQEDQINLPDNVDLSSSAASLVADESARDSDRPGNSAQSAIGASSDVSTPASQSTGGTLGTTVSEHLRSMIWAVLGLMPNAVAAQCTFEDLIIEKATARAGAIFSGLDLIGMSFFSLLQEKCTAAVIRRMMLVNQSMADSSQSDIPSFVAKTLGRFSVLGVAGQALDLVLSMAHLPADSPSASGPDGRHIILVMSEQQQQRRGGGVSVASSDICPSDSVSVGKRRPQFMSSDLQRSKLRASFFEADSRMSAVSGGHSSPRALCRRFCWMMAARRHGQVVSFVRFRRPSSGWARSCGTAPPQRSRSSNDSRKEKGCRNCEASWCQSARARRRRVCQTRGCRQAEVCPW
ncbi:GBA [Symbiodinium microadriaticum]|nr:GBA [Symbiodinium microadriaticum]